MLQLFVEHPASKCLTARVAPGSELKRSIWLRSWGWHHIRLSGKDVSVGEKKILGWNMVIPRGKNSKEAHICHLPSQHLEHPGREFPKDTDPLPFSQQCSFSLVSFSLLQGTLKPGPLASIGSINLRPLFFHDLGIPGHACCSQSSQFDDLTSALPFNPGCPAPATIGHLLN